MQSTALIKKDINFNCKNVAAKFLPLVDILRLFQVSKSWNALSKNEQLWMFILLNDASVNRVYSELKPEIIQKLKEHFPELKTTTDVVRFYSESSPWVYKMDVKDLKIYSVLEKFGFPLDPPNPKFNVIDYYFAAWFLIIRDGLNPTIAKEKLETLRPESMSILACGIKDDIYNQLNADQQNKVQHDPILRYSQIKKHAQCHSWITESKQNLAAPQKDEKEQIEQAGRHHDHHHQHHGLHHHGRNLLKVGAALGKFGAMRVVKVRVQINIKELLNHDELFHAQLFKKKR